MYTHCPHCATAFRITARELRLGRGRVRCGLCMGEFNALEFLRDDKGAPEPGQDLASDQQRPRQDLRPQAAAEIQDGMGMAEDAEPDTLPGERTLEATAADADAVDEARRAAPGTAVLPAVLRRAPDDPSNGRRGGVASVLLSVACAVLVLLLGAQYAWFEPSTLLRQYPQFHAVLEGFCHYAGCQLPDRRAPERIQIVSRDVRIHPSYEGALQIKATLVNAFPRVQAFPRLRFTLFNVNGEIIASRVFRPEHYLDPKLEVEQGMQPKAPVEIALDVLALEEAAVSFEFVFL